MRILIADSVGAGAVIGSQLAGARRDVTFLDHARRVTAEMFKPLEVRGERGTFRQYMRHIEDAEVWDAYDVVIVSVQAHEVSGLMAGLARAAGPQTIMLSLVPGLDPVTRLKAACPCALVLDGLHDLVVTRNDAGAVIQLGMSNRILIGAASSAEGDAAHQIAALFKNTALDVEIIVDAEKRRWEHLVRVVGLVGLAALMQVNLEEIGAIDVNYTHLWSFVQEAATVAISAGQKIDVADLALFMEELPGSVPLSLHAMLDDVAKGELSAVTELVHQMHRFARRVSVPTPVLDLAYSTLLIRSAAAGNRCTDTRAPRPQAPPRREGWFSRPWRVRSAGDR